MVSNAHNKSGFIVGLTAYSEELKKYAWLKSSILSNYEFAIDFTVCNLINECGLLRLQEQN